MRQAGCPGLGGGGWCPPPVVFGGLPCLLSGRAGRGCSAPLLSRGAGKTAGGASRGPPSWLWPRSQQDRSVCPLLCRWHPVQSPVAVHEARTSGDGIPPAFFLSFKIVLATPIFFCLSTYVSLSRHSRTSLLKNRLYSFIYFKIDFIF